jgi:hypothetical protein
MNLADYETRLAMGICKLSQFSTYIDIANTDTWHDCGLCEVIDECVEEWALAKVRVRDGVWVQNGRNLVLHFNVRE